MARYWGPSSCLAPTPRESLPPSFCPGLVAVPWHAGGGWVHSGPWTKAQGGCRFHGPRRFWLLSPHASRGSTLLMAGRSRARGETTGQQGKGGTRVPHLLPLQLLASLLGSAGLSHSQSPCKPFSVLSLSHSPLCLECPCFPFHQVALNLHKSFRICDVLQKFSRVISLPTMTGVAGL